MEIKNQINGGDEEIKNKMKKKRSRMHVINVVLYMLRRRRRSKPFNNGFWRRVVEPFGLLKNDDITTLPSSNITILPSSSPAKEEAPTSGDDLVPEMVEVFTAPSSSSSSGISGYGSAKSLRDLECLGEDDDGYDNDDEDEEECYGDDNGGDEMIDVKAEEFIVKFYEQMRMQNQAYTGRYKANVMMTVKS